MSKLKGKKVLVTGGAGFVGFNLLHKLAHLEAQLHVIVRKSTDPWRLNSFPFPYKIYEADLSDMQAIAQIVKDIQPHFIYHLAHVGGHPTDPLAFEKVLHACTSATLNLLEAAQRNGCERFLHIGSSTEYGEAHGFFNENDVLKPITWKGIAKGAESLICHRYAQAGQLPILQLRLFHVYGPWEQSIRFIPKIVQAFIQKGTIGLTAQKSLKDFIYVDDVVAGLVKAASIPVVDGSSPVYNLGSGKQHSNYDIVDVLEDYFSYSIPINKGAYPSKRCDASNPLAGLEITRKELDWEASTSFEEGIKKTAHWFQNHLPEIHPY